MMKFAFEALVSEAGRDTEPVSVRQLPPKRGKIKVKCKARQECLSLFCTTLVKRLISNLDISLL